MSENNQSTLYPTSAWFFGADALKGGFEKFNENLETAQSFGKDRFEAYMQSAAVAGKGIGALQEEIYSFSKQSLDNSVATAKAFFGAKSLEDVFTIQSDFAKNNIAAYFAQAKKVNELVASTAKNSFASFSSTVLSAGTPFAKAAE